jgi:2-succinyl-5-enolpyruvyl-6-hydroxy-3-cyclohexene-1-carboxylate synthase
MRGANGIDGTISFASGIARASQAPTLLILGDLAFCHDLTGLMAARSLSNLTLLLLNNNGGGIFHFLPACGTSEHFETIQGTPHGLNLSALKDVFGIAWKRVLSRPEMAPAIGSASRGLRVLEVNIERQKNFQAYGALIKRLCTATTS